MSTSQLVADLLLDLYPGNDCAIVRVREELARVSAIPGPVVVLLEGPPGSGKTTMARTIAVCRRILTASPTALLPTRERARTEVLSHKPLTWYRDISLAGLVESLADAQLFGIGEKVASEVTSRIGIFEQAMTGHDVTDPSRPHEELIKAAKEKNRWAPLVTGGVVLLDEIGDLPAGLQAKLLRVLNSEKQYRVGKEGNDSFAFQYLGMTVLATWRDLESSIDFRRDLWQRICQNRIQVPSLAVYSTDNRLELIQSIYRQFREQIADELERLRHLESGTKSEITSPEWVLRLAQLSKQNLASETAVQLSKLDFDRIGEFRGLKSVISRVMLGSSLVDAVPDSPSSVNQSAEIREAEAHCIDVFARVLAAPTLSVGWRQYRLEWANQLNQLLLGHSSKAEKLIQAGGKKRSEIKKQIENLLRSELSVQSGETE
jgi:hypothetical protein